MDIRVLGGPIVYQQVYSPASVYTGLQYLHNQPFGVRFYQVQRPTPDTSKGIQYFYFHPFGKLYLPEQVDGEYEIVIPPDGSPTYMGGRIGLHRSMKTKGKFDQRDIKDLIDILTLMDIC